MAPAPGELEPFFELSSELLALLAPDGHLIRVNAAFAHSLGHVAGELAGREWLSLVHPEDLAGARVEWQRLGRGIPEARYENRCVHKDGSVRHLAWIARRVDGHEALYLTARDLTDRRGAQPAFETIFHCAPITMALSGQDGRYLAVNDSFTEVVGYSREQVLGATGASLGLVDPAARSAIIDELRRHGRVRGLQIGVRTASGGHLDMAVYIEPIELHGRPCTLSMNVDVTELLRMRAALVQSEKMAAIGVLSAGIAHEINNPLAYVSNNLFILERDSRGLLALLDVYESARGALAEADPDAAEHARHLAAQMDLPHVRERLGKLLGKAREGVQRVTRIVESMRSLARTDRPAPEPVKLADLVNMCLEMIGGRLRRRGVQVQLDFAPDATVFCVPTQMGQALLNLISNALQAVESTGRTDGGHIRIASRRQGEEQVIEVEDNGCGIAPENVQRIFEPFFTTKPVGEGMGLGLAITHTIIAGHRGRIEVESAVGEGSRFRIFLPAMQKRGSA